MRERTKLDEVRFRNVRDGVSTFGRVATVLVRCLVARFRSAFERAPFHRNLASDTMFVRFAVHQVPVLGASRVLYEQHVAALRALKKQSRHG